MTAVRVTVARPEEWEEITELRRVVFILEQGVPEEIERDDLDATALHAAARDEAGTLIGTGRAVIDGGGPGVARVGRMAVAPSVRGRGVGAAVLSLLEREAAARGATRVLLHAQDHAIGFYAGAGYVPEGEPFTEAGIAHLAMARDLP